MRACTVSAACVCAGGPVKVRRIRKKTTSVSLDLVAAATAPVFQSSALIPLESSLGKKRRLDQRVRQSARSTEARRLETEKKKQKRQQQAFSVVAPLLQEIKARDETIAALRQELAKVSAERAADAAAIASMAADNWKDGVACGRRGWGTPPTPRTAARAAQVVPA